MQVYYNQLIQNRKIRIYLYLMILCSLQHNYLFANKFRNTET